VIEAKPKVFISYSVGDADDHWMREFVRTLRSLGIQATFSDSLADLRLKDTAIDQLEHGLRHSDLVVLVLSKATSTRPDVLFEFGAAVGLGKKIFVVVPHDINFNEIPLAVIRAEKVLLEESPTIAAEAVAAAARAA